MYIGVHWHTLVLQSIMESHLAMSRRIVRAPLPPHHSLCHSIHDHHYHHHNQCHQMIMTQLICIWIFICQHTKKHRKNCECCPVSQLIVRSQRLSWIQVLNCQNCSQCLKCHKSLGLLLGGVLKMTLSLSLSLYLSLSLSIFAKLSLQLPLAE